MKEKLLQIGNTSTCPVAVIMRDGCILMGHRNYTKDKWKEVSVWTMPGGRCDAGETVERALRREVMEEVGINQLQILEHIGDVPGAKDGDVVPLFFCETSQDFTLMEPEKFSEWRWVPKEEYLKGAYSGFNQAARDAVTSFLKER